MATYNQYDKINEITFSEEGVIGTITDDTAYTETITINNQEDFWYYLKVQNGQIVITTI